ncbi:Very-long-chain 3-oxoacyl-CoA reductase [Penicillium rolfsii]|nr:Very-long-chain 3-oxoacyl-CoA reductase [Penicillium rolfsii]
MDLPNWTTTLSTIGLATLSYLAYQLARQAGIYLLPSKLPRYNLSGNNWALVTGATDGIGFGFCEELCSRGFNVILHGRNREKLVQRASELNTAFPGQKTGIVVLDIVGMDHGVDDVAEQVRSIIRNQGHGQGRLSVLVNNVGGEKRPAVTLGALSYADVDATIDKNARCTAHMTRVLLPLLSEGQGRSGLVMNVSSLSQYGLPYVSVYSATKGFVDSFTRALEAECSAEGCGVEVMGLRVAEVKTAGYDIDSNLFVPVARTLAKAGLDRVGCGKVIVWAYFWHWLQGLSFDIMPRRVLMRATIGRMMAIRKRREEKAGKRQ